MINIITSYPKSGNTWMRYIIYEMCFNKENKDNDNSLNIKKYIPDLHILKIENNKLTLNKELKNKEIFLKSHFSYSQMKNFSIKKIIIILRNPLDIFVSLTNFYELNIEEIDNLVNYFSKHHTLPFIKEKFKLPSWSEHLESWVNSSQNLLVIKYKDLINNFNNQMIKISHFLEVEIDNQKIELIKNNTSFLKLKTIENKEREKKIDGFFYEHMKNKKTNFMFSGQNKNYLDFLNENQIMKINLGFKTYIEEYSL